MLSNVCVNVELYPMVSFSTNHQKFIVDVSSPFCGVDILLNVTTKGPHPLLSCTVKSTIGVGNIVTVSVVISVHPLSVIAVSSII